MSEPVVVVREAAEPADVGYGAATVAGATAVAVAEAVTDAVQEIAADSIEALRQENAQLRAEIATLQETPQELHIHEGDTVIIEAEPVVEELESEPVEVIVVEDDTPDPLKETSAPDRKPRRRPYGKS